MPDSAEAVASLNAYATAGKIPNLITPASVLYYPITESTGISEFYAAFSQMEYPYIRRTCDVPLSQTPSDPASVRVYQNCIEILPATGDASVNDTVSGWTIDTSYSPAHLEFVGDACTQLQTYGAQAVDVFFDCPSN